MPVRWADVESRLRDDENVAFLCDIVVPNAASGDWQLVLDLLHEHATAWGVEYSEDGSTGPLPRNAERLVARSAEAALRIRTSVNGLPIIGHVFADDWIEFDVPTRSLDGQPSLDALIGYLETLGRALGKQVYATPEAAHDEPVLVYEPANDLVYLAQMQ